MSFVKREDLRRNFLDSKSLTEHIEDVARAVREGFVSDRTYYSGRAASLISWLETNVMPGVEIEKKDIPGDIALLLEWEIHEFAISKVPLARSETYGDRKRHLSTISLSPR